MVSPSDWVERSRRNSLTLLLDLDGTLIPFGDTVEEATLDRPGANLLDALTVAGVRVVLVSGRQRKHLEQVGFANLWRVAEHGVWRRSTGDWEGQPREVQLEAVEAELEAVAAIPGCSIERKSRSICVHWRLVAAAQRESLITRVRDIFGRWTLALPDYSILDGALALELRHRSANKGSAVEWVRAQQPDAHMIAIGDDHTDEDMFAMLRPDEVAIVVLNARSRSTRARLGLESPTAVREFLWWLVEARTGEPSRPLRLAPIRS